MKLLYEWSCPFTELSQPTGAYPDDMNRSKFSTEAATPLPIRTGDLLVLIAAYTGQALSTRNSLSIHYLQ